MSQNGNYVSIGAIEVSKALQVGEKFVKWDEDSCNGTPVTMRVDSKGFFLYWIDQNNEMDVLDISTIRDVRTGQYAKRPKDSKLRQIVTMGSQDTLEEKTVTVCHGFDFVNIFFINFCCTKKEIAVHWTEELMRLAYNLTQLNGSTAMFLQKAHTKLCLQVDKSGKIPVKNIVKLFTVNKDDRKRVEKALEATGLPYGKVETVAPSKFDYNEFFNLYKNLTQRTEVENIFSNLVGSSKKRCMTAAQLVEFLNKTQRDPRLNEILHPYANVTRAKEIICEHEPNKMHVQKGFLSLDGFLRYLMSGDNPIMATNHLDLCDDMDQPLSHYFINSSHNTYLTGHQITGRSSVEIYRQCLLAGCRCVELDFWDGKGRTEEPVIVHGYTLVPEICAKDVLEAIAESAFKTSEFPIILSFENHCKPRQQAKIANYCRDIFGDMLLDKPIDSHPLEPNIELPPPSFLKRKIIIKNKKKHHHHHHHKRGTFVSPNQLTTTNSGTLDESVHNSSPQILPAGNEESFPNHAPVLQHLRQSSKESSASSDTDSSTDDESIQATTLNPPLGAEPPAEKTPKETEAGAEISALVNYVQPVHFSSFENAEKKGRCYEMSSFDEKQATTLLKERPIEFVNYNKHQLSRVYPAGTRFDSSNFMPQLFWNAGCQLVALNYQTLDLAMQLNMGIFEYNERCGFLLKPEFMRRTDRRLDPFAESTVDGIIAGTVSITVLSGQFLTDKKVGTYVEVDMFGLPADTVRKKFRTKIIRDNGINPVYDDEPFVFKKVVLPELASIRVAVYEEGGKFVGHRVLPVIGLCPGYRHVHLRTECGQPLLLASLFLCIIVKDYVPDDLSNFAEALANPIKYQSELEKRDKQLAVFTEDMEPTAEEISNPYQRKELRPVHCSTSSPKSRSTVQTSSSISLDATTDNQQDTPRTFSHSMPSQFSTEQTVLTSSGFQGKMQQQQSQHQGEIILEADEIFAEPLNKILNHKLVTEKIAEMEKKLETLRKKHDKEKVKVSSCAAEGSKKTKFSMTNRLVKRLSNKTLDVRLQVPPCSNELEVPDKEKEEDQAGSPGMTRSQSERLLSVCKEFSTGYREIQEKYHEIIYSTAEKVLKNSQANQMKQLKTSLDRVTNEVMQQLQIARRNEVKTLSLIHRDRDEFVRMKREVASSVVERGVAERVRLRQAYDKKTEELQRQHDIVRAALAEHKSKARSFLDKDSDSRSCVSSDGFLVLLKSPVNFECAGSTTINESSASRRMANSSSSITSES